MVTSQKIRENEMGYRGSKSDLVHKFVKEQRVDGSWCINKMHLRCTLTGFERNRSACNLSNHIINKQLYHTYTSALWTRRYSVASNSSLNPWLVSGFTDGDGSFSVSISKKSTGTGYKIQPLFHIGLDQKDLHLLEQIQAFFKVGKIYTNNKGILQYSVGSLKDITREIIPHFVEYPLAGKKRKDFELFKEIVDLMNRGEHKTHHGLLKIISLRASLNLGLSTTLKAAFPNVIPAVIPTDNVSNELEPFFYSRILISRGKLFYISLWTRYNG